MMACDSVREATDRLVPFAVTTATSGVDAVNSARRDRPDLVLLDIIHQQQQHIARLEDEIVRLKGLTPRPTIQPSTLEAPASKPPDPDRKRPGSDKRRKNAQLTIHREVLVPLPNPPPLAWDGRVGNAGLAAAFAAPPSCQCPLFFSASTTSRGM